MAKSGDKIDNGSTVKSNGKIENLPPSAKLVLKILEQRGSMTQKEITRESYLPPRTVRYALNRLKKNDILEERFYFKDARQSLYGLKIFHHEEAEEADLHV